MNFQIFESLRVWHHARRLVVAIYQATGGNAFAGDSGLKDQIRRSSISVMSNIAEGCERGGAREFLRFLRIAKGSAGEIRCQLYAAEDLGYLATVEARALRQQAAVVSRQVAALLRQHSSKE